LAKKLIDAGDGHVDAEMLTFIAGKSADTVAWLKSQGVAFGSVTYSYNDPTQSPLRNHKTADGAGTGFILPLKAAAEKAGVEIRLETKAVSLINEGGIIKGVVAENGGRTVTVNAPSTILATGGFANNAELVAEYCPKLGTSGTFLGETHNGDGLIMARDAGAKIVAGGGAIVNPMDLGPTYFADPAGIFLNVTPAGKRFANEASYWFTRSAALYFDEGYNYYYSIFDAKTEHAKLEDAIAAGTIIKANTIAELAAGIQIDPAVLAANVDRYNTMCAAGKDTDFGKSASGPKGVTVEVLQENVPFLTAIDTAPFYALKVPTTGLTGTFGGPAITIDGEVISTDGSVIPGLYAAGEVANGQLLYHEYPCSGTSIQICATMGRQAGAAAAKASVN
jgi:fumarate reductase flavoprotein subunit